MSVKHSLIRLILFSTVFLVESCFDSNPKDSSKDLTLAKQLNGTWGSPEGLPGFRIQDDSIYHYPLKAMLPCYLKKDTFSVKFPDRDTLTLWGIVKVVDDTLFIKTINSPIGAIKAYKLD